MADALVTIGADLGEMRRELAKLPNMTDESAQKMLVKLERAVKSAEGAAKKAGKAVGKAAEQAAKESQAAAKQTREGLLELGDLVGLPADGIKKLGAGMGALASPAGVAAIAIGGVTLAAGALVAGVVAAVTSADELARELEGIKGLGQLEGFGLSDEALAGIDRANAAFDAMGVIVKQAIIVLGEEFAPIVEKAGTLLVKLSLMALDAWESFSAGNDVLREVAVWLGDRMVKAMTGPVDGLMTMIGLMADLAVAAGASGLGESLQQLEDRWDGWTRSVAKSGVDMAFNAISQGLDLVNTATGNYDERAAKLIGTLKAHADAQRAVTKTVKDTTGAELAAAKAAEDAETARSKAIASGIGGLARIEDSNRTAMATEEEKIAMERDAAMQAADAYARTALMAADTAAERAAIEQQLSDTRVAIEENTNERLAAIDEERSRTNSETEQKRRDMILGAAMDCVDALSSLWSIFEDNRLERVKELEGAYAESAENMTEAQRAAAEEQIAEAKKQAMIAFRVGQGLALAQGTMAAWLAAAQAFAATAAIPVIGPALAPAVAAATFVVAEASTVAQIAMQKPPSFGDTPGVQQMENGGIVRLAEDDYFAAAKDPAELLRQVQAFSGGTETPDLVHTLPLGVAALGPVGVLALATGTPQYEDTPRVQKVSNRSPPPTRTPAPQPTIVVQQRGTIVDERVTRFRVRGPGALSRALTRSNSPGKR